MKKFMKGCGITALVLLILGLIMAVVAGTIQGRTTIEDVVEGVTGGRVRLNLDFWEDWGITIGDDIMNSLEEWDSDMKFNIGDNISFDKSFEIFKGDMDKTLLGKNVSRLDIEAAGCYLEMKQSEDDNFYMKGVNIGKAQGFVKNDTLYVKAYKTGKVSVNDVKSCKIILYVPADSRFEKAEIELGAGLIKLADMQAEELDVEAGAGGVEFFDMQIGKLKASVGMGKISLDNIQVQTLEAEVGMGSLEMQGDILQSADLECSMGSIEMRVKGEKEDFNYYLEGAMGNIIIGGESFSGLGQERTIRNNAEKNINVECAMGNIAIDFTL